MLELENVTVGYTSASKTLDGLSLSVPDGSVVALLGPNGAGKTTTLRTASRMIPLQSGRITFEGKDVSKLAPHQMSKLGLCHVPEGRGIFPALSVRDNIALFGRGMPPSEAVDKAIDAFAFIEHRIDLPAGSLSGGERQMLALVRAWLTRPKIVLLDEVSMGLAPLIVDEVYAFIRRLAEEGISLLMVEQYVDRVRRFADHIYLMRSGEIRFSGTPHELGSEEDILGHYLGAALQE
ncbi:ABC transporter ATP-binding protein [Aeromicrobium ginsengisoli]|uniref:ABC transporter ATP-binding protein n=1 Tax=Aeromicrobium ginsengisoli TaxID=363867 RepID=A0A5M4F989_9ACTN|nr:ABC transporter ATP-binding protein [Aeromicrobium ginsengisoli]KAA1394263.1 ABC transporter ATP-binding protein [Aeromicrobium ginsengisoli]